MKILLIAADLSQVGGIQRYNRMLTRAVRSAGHELRVLEFKGRGLPAKLFFAVRTFLTAAKFRPGIVIAAHLNFGGLALFIKRTLGFPYVLTLFGIEARTATILKKENVLRGASRLTTVSEYTVEKIIAAWPDLRSRMFSLENPVDGSVFHPEPRSEELLTRYKIGGRKVLLTVSRLAASEKYKGYDKVLLALNKVAATMSDFRYILIGDGDDRPRVEKMIAELGLKGKVILPGLVSEAELVQYYNLADVFVMPSRFEGFGFVFIEALACGVPVIAGNQDGSPHALLEGRLGILVDPESPEEIAAAIVGILTRTVPPEFLDRRFLRTNVLAAYGVEVFNNKVKNLLHEL